MTNNEIKNTIEQWFIDAEIDGGVFGISEMYALLLSEGRRNLRYWSDRYEYSEMEELDSKSKRITKEIIPIIQKYVDNPLCYGYIEPFCGGCNVIDKINHTNKKAYDVHKYLIALLEQAKQDCSVFPKTIDKETYYDVKDKMGAKYDNWFIGLVGFCASHNGKWFGGYADDVKTKIETVRNYTEESIRNLVKQSKYLKNIQFNRKDFRSLSDMRGYVIYCDPPYRGTTKYIDSDFPYDEFYQWCRNMAKNNIVLVSEYNMPDDFECIWSKEIPILLDSRIFSENENARTKKLFMAKYSTPNSQ